LHPRRHRSFLKHGITYICIPSFHWHVQNAMIPCCSQECLLLLSVIYFFLPLFSTNYSSLLPHFSCHLFLGLPHGLVSKFIYNTPLGIPFPSILCTCPNQRNLCNLIVSVIVGFLTLLSLLW
jgi:hypothetical protein